MLTKYNLPSEYVSTDLGIYIQVYISTVLWLQKKDNPFKGSFVPLQYILYNNKKWLNSSPFTVVLYHYIYNTFLWKNVGLSLIMCETVLNYNVLYLGWTEIQLCSLQHAVKHRCQVCRYMVLTVSCSLHAPYNMQSNTAVKTNYN